MGHDIKFILINADDSFATHVREVLLKFPGRKIIAEVEEPALFAQAIKQFPVDVALVNLDPNPEALLPIIGDVIAANRNLAVFATSQSTDGPLILKTMRLGVKEFLPKPIDPNALNEAVDRVEATRGDVANQATLITVTGTAGGVGSTMFATNLAVELASMAEGTVTLVDLDYRYGQVATLLDVEPTYTLADLCGSPEHLEPQVLGKALAQHESGVRVLSRPATFAEAETITAASCAGVFSTLMEMNEYVVADGPTRFDVGAKSLITLSDVNLLIVQLLIPSVRNAVRMLETMRQGGYNLDRIRLVCNRVGRDAGHLTVDNIEETLGIPVFASIPDDWNTVSAAINLGEPLSVHSPKSKVCGAIQEIAHRLHTPDAEADDKDARKKSLIGRIFASN